jgi:hypothetical protein
MRSKKGSDMRRISIVLAVLVAAALTTTAAFGSNVHFKRGGSPTCTVSGTGTNSITTSCTGSVAGLGGADIEIDLTTSGSAVYQCQNSGGNIAPGQNKVLVGPSTSPTFIPGGEVKNGNLTFTVSNADDPLTAPGTVSAADAGCNRSWTGVNPQLMLTDITLQFFQPADPKTLVFTCTAHSDTGLSGTVPLTCTFA